MDLPLLSCVSLFDMGGGCLRVSGLGALLDPFVGVRVPSLPFD